MKIHLEQTITYKGHVVFERLSMDYWRRMPKMFQKNEACFMFVNEGEYSVRAPKEFLSFQKGKALLAKCFDYFFECSPVQQQSSERIDVVGVFLYPEIVSELFDFNVLEHPTQHEITIAQVEVDALLKSFQDSLNVLLKNPQLADEEMVKTKLKEFILILVKTRGVREKDFLASLFKPTNFEFRGIIHQNAYSNLSLAEFAHLCSLSLSSFKRKFQEEFNASPKQYLTKLKMEKAEELLRTSHLRISEVAYDCGYETISTFNRAFKAYFGSSPKDFLLNQNAQSLG